MSLSDVKLGFFFGQLMQQNITTKLNLKPATLAILIQCVALLVLILTSWAIHWFSEVFFGVDVHISDLFLVILQATYAWIFSYLAGMAKWWRWIHLCFPMAIWVMFNLNFPNELYLIGFIVTLSLYWTTFRTQVPFYPSGPVVWDKVTQLIPTVSAMRMVDIGSGLGDMAMHIAKVRSNCLVEGIEIAPLPWLISVVRAKLKRSAAIFKMGDYRDLNFADYNVIFAYLSPAAMQALWQKASAEMKSGSLLISYEFEIIGVPPSQVIGTASQYKKLYVWKL